MTRDWGALARLLTDDVWLRVLLPRGIAEHHDRAADGRVRRLDLVCTGFHPLTAADPA